MRISFDSRHGPLTYASDAYEHRWPSDPPSWQANVRAIALALEALRAVDRYGVTRSGEQYRGWSAIEGGSGQMSVEAAARLLADAGDTSPTAVLANQNARTRAYRHAARTHHPDAGGDPEVSCRITEARGVLDCASDLAGGGTRC